MNTPTAKPIICGTDFSESAAAAASVAGALARHLAAPLLLVHSADERGELPDETRARLLERDRPRLAQEAERLRGLGLTLEAECLQGAPEDGVAAAARAGARLVVVGASGTGSLWAGDRWLIGNVAERIAETSSVPTLVVRAAAPFVGWARGERPLRIFIAADFTATAEAALRWVAEWRQIGACEITVGYVHRAPDERGELAIFDALGLTSLTPPARQGLERDLLEKASRLLGLAPTTAWSSVRPGWTRI